MTTTGRCRATARAQPAEARSMAMTGSAPICSASTATTSPATSCAESAPLKETYALPAGWRAAIRPEEAMGRTPARAKILSEPLLIDDRAPPVAHAVFIEGNRDWALGVSVQPRNHGTPVASPRFRGLKQRGAGPSAPYLRVHDQGIHDKPCPAVLARELCRRVRTWFLYSRGKPANGAAIKIGGELQDILASAPGPSLKVACKSLRAGHTKVIRIEVRIVGSRVQPRPRNS